MTTEPRTEAGRRLWGWLQVIAAGEMPPPRETGLLAILAIEAEAAAGPRDVQALDIIIRQVEYRAYGHALVNLRALRAAAGPRDEGLDVDRLARAMWNVRAGGVIDNRHAAEVAREYAALAKASEV